MSNRPDIDDLFRKELDGMAHEYSDALWQKLDAQLQPERDAFHKKDKKRRAAWLVLPLALLIGGAVWYFAGRSSSSSNPPETIAANTENNTGNPVSTEKTALQKGTDSTGSAQIGMAGNTDLVDPQKTLPANQPGTTGNQQAGSPATATPGNKNAAVKQAHTNVQQPAPAVTVAQQKNKASKNNIVVSRSKNNKPAIVDNNDAAVSKGKNNKTIALPGKEDESGPTPVEEVKEAPAVESNPAVNQAETPKVEVPVTANKTDNKPEENKTAVTKQTPKKVMNQTRLGVSVMAGTNLSSPFRKPGAFGGVLFTKTIDGKHVFAGLKISSNQLDHQLVIAGKQNQPTPPQTDAVIEKLVILQMPFGYEFKLNAKGKPATTFLQAGFEPAYIVGLRTIYYDDNGVPGGPVTPVLNSPLMSKAINRFNLSFVAGIRKQITPRIGITLNGGYSLIDITDKQYYNRTSTNNNLKYIQAGLLFRLNK